MNRTWKEIERDLRKCGQVNIGETYIHCNPKGGFQAEEKAEGLSRSYPNLETLGLGLDLTPSDFSQALDVPSVNIWEREKQLNLASRDLVRGLPKDKRKDLNGPVRSLLGAYNRRARTEALVEGKPIVSVENILGEAANDVGNALEKEHPKTALAARVLSLVTENIERKQRWLGDRKAQE